MRKEILPTMPSARTLTHASAVEDTYRELASRQGGLCKCCGRAETAEDVLRKRRRLTLYYSNVTGEILGLICRACSVGLQMFDDSPTLLAKALAFVTSAVEIVPQVQETRAKLESRSDDFIPLRDLKNGA